MIFGGDLKKYPIPEINNIWHCNAKSKYFRMLLAMHTADKIIIHGLFDIRLVRILALTPWLLKKCYWVMWGGDLYWGRHENIPNYNLGWRWQVNEKFRTFVIRHFGHFITHIKGDYELAKEWYGASGQWHECFMYPSNLYNDYPRQPKTHNTINIQVGNSADPSNYHMEILEKLKVFRDQAIRIYVPLSYGDMAYAKNIMTFGKNTFGDKFIPLTGFIPFEKYLDLLAQIDIAIFNHRRQQGMGNTTSLLGLGAKVYMRSDVTPWKMFNDLGVAIFDSDKINLDKLNFHQEMSNIKTIKQYFSKEALIVKLKHIF